MLLLSAEYSCEYLFESLGQSSLACSADKRASVQPEHGPAGYLQMPTRRAKRCSLSFRCSPATMVIGDYDHAYRWTIGIQPAIADAMIRISKAGADPDGPPAK